MAIVGRPNAGKSSLVNRLLREDRMIVSEMPGTTRDPVDSVFQWHRKKVRIVDTAGIRKAGRVARGGAVESLSVLLARRSIAQADVVVVVIDAIAGATDQDAAIAGEAEAAGRGIVVAVNKWDLIEDRGADAAGAVDDEIRRRLPFLDFAPILHISALTGAKTPRLLELIDRVAVARRRRVPTPELNRFVAAITAAQLAGRRGAAFGAGAVCGADRRGAADLRVLHQRRRLAALLLRALPDQSPAGGVRLRGLADPAPRAAPGAQPRKAPAGPDLACYTPEFRGSGLCGTCGATCMVAPKLERLKAADVCQIAQVQPYVLRTWEAEFPDLGQQTAAGPRIYGRADVERVLRIRELVYVEGLTLAGARRRLEESAPSRQLDGSRGLRAGRRADANADPERSAGTAGRARTPEPAGRRRGVRAGAAQRPEAPVRASKSARKAKRTA